MKAVLVLVLVFLVACTETGDNSSLNDDPAETGVPTPSTDNPDDDSTDPTEVENPAVRYPVKVNRTSTPDLFVDFDLTQESNLPDNQHYLEDINGDGLREISVYVPGTKGTAYAAVLFGTESGLYPEVDELNGSNGFVLDNLRQPLKTIGDINGDGLAEISLYNSGWFESPEWRVLAGASSFPMRRNSLHLPKDDLLIHLRLLTDADPAGDINGDGMDDLLLGSTSGVAPRIVYGSSNLKLTDPSSPPGGGILDYCDTGFCTTWPFGDFDGDGYDDLLISRFSCRYSNYTAILYGSPTGIVARDFLDDYPEGDITRIVSDSGAECFEGTARLSGDIDNDGKTDLLFGNVNFEHPETEGHLVFGASNPRLSEISVNDLDGAKGFYLEWDSELRIDDFDDDGYADILYPDGKMFAGRNRKLDSIATPVVRRGKNIVEVFWTKSLNPDVTYYELSINSTVVQYDSSQNSASLENIWGTGSLTVVLDSMNADGRVLASSRREVPDYAVDETLTAQLLAPRQIELTLVGRNRTFYYAHYLIWRNGVPIGRTINGATNYVDSDVALGATYQYFFTPDYLRNESLDADVLRMQPLLQRQSNIVEIRTPDN